MNQSTFLQDQLLTTKFFIPSPSHTLIPRSSLPHSSARACSTNSRSPRLPQVSARPPYSRPGCNRCHWVTRTLPGSPWMRETMIRCILGVCAHGTQQLPTRALYSPLDFLTNGQSPSIHSLLTAFINILVEQTEQFLLVLDDYDMITEPAFISPSPFCSSICPPNCVSFWRPARIPLYRSPVCEQATRCSKCGLSSFGVRRKRRWLSSPRRWALP